MGSGVSTSEGSGSTGIGGMQRTGVERKEALLKAVDEVAKESGARLILDAILEAVLVECEDE